MAALGRASQAPGPPPLSRPSVPPRTCSGAPPEILACLWHACLLGVIPPPLPCTSGLSGLRRPSDHLVCPMLPPRPPLSPVWPRPAPATAESVPGGRMPPCESGRLRPGPSTTRAPQRQRRIKGSFVLYPFLRPTHGHTSARAPTSNYLVPRLGFAVFPNSLSLDPSLGAPSRLMLALVGLADVPLH